MQVCKCIFGAAVFLLLNVCVSAQSSVFDMTMPTVSSPTIGNGFYVPGNASNSVYTGPSSKNAAATQPSASSSPSASVAASESDAEDDALSSISARDLSLLSQKGLLGQLGSIFDDRSYSYDNAYKSGSSDETNKLLKKVLNRLEEIKGGESGVAESNAASRVESAQAPVSAPVAPSASVVDSALSAKSNLLRFTVNGYDVLRTCRTVYISDVQKDGTFLVTGDRRYNANGRMMNETFHILFKAKPDSADCANYSSATVVTQDVENPNSFLYQLAQRKNMEATRTGNFVSMRTTDSNWKLELLVDLGE
ncbi:MAG: hypothetical protein IJ828_09455 [Treponema sp.]|nr:hypothetical protein [Treponema sp.]